MRWLFLVDTFVAQNLYHGVDAFQTHLLDIILLAFTFTVKSLNLNLLCRILSLRVPWNLLISRCILASFVLMPTLPFLWLCNHIDFIN